MKIDRELYKRISNLTMTDYSGIVLSEDTFFIEEETIINMFKDLIYEMGRLEERKDEEIQSLKWKIQDMNDHNIY